MSPSPVSPVDVPGPDSVAVETRLHPRCRQVPEHHADHRPVPGELEITGRTPERRHDGRHDAIALLPVGAEHLERNPRAPRPVGSSLERHGGQWRRGPARRNLDPVPLEREPHLAAEGETPGCATGLEGLRGIRPSTRGAARPNAARQQPDPIRRTDRDRALAAPVGEPSQGPLEPRFTGELSLRTHALHPERVEQALEIGRCDSRDESGEARLGRTERLHRECEVEVAAIEGRVGARYFEAVACPDELALERRIIESRKNRTGAGETAGKLAAALEQMPLSGERRRAGHREVVPGEEDVLHHGEVNRRLADVVDRLGPVEHVDAPVDERVEAVRPQIDARELDEAAIERVVGVHADLHRLEVTDQQCPAVERGAPPVARRLGHRQVDVGSPDAPRRAVILVDELAVVRAQILDRRDYSPRRFRGIGRGPGSGAPGSGSARIHRRLLPLHEPREGVASVLETLDEHPPTAQVDRVHEHLAPAAAAAIR